MPAPADPTLAHELRTPLHGVLASVALLLDTPLSAEQREHVATIRDAADALLRLANESLGIGAPAPDGGCAVRVVLDGVQRLLAAPARARGITLATHVDDAVPATLDVPSDRLRQVLVNLVGNAIVHSGGRTVQVDVARSAAGVRVAVRDDGRGLTPDARAHLFVPRPRPTRRATGTDGAGLGLAITADIVRALGGTIGMRVPDGGGCEFRVELPCAADAPAPAAAPRAPIPARVLVVDDERVAREVTARMIERLGGTVRAVASVADAVTALATAEYDVVLVDWQLRDGTGADVAAAVRVDTCAARTAVVALTGSVEPATHARCRAAGMRASLCKPIGLDVLARTLAACLPPRADEPLLDAARVASLVALDGDASGLLARVAADYARTAERHLATLERAIAAGDASAAAHAAHALRGSSATAGAVRAATLAAAVERATYAPGALAGAADTLPALRDAVAATARALHDRAHAASAHRALTPAS